MKVLKLRSQKEEIKDKIKSDLKESLNPSSEEYKDLSKAELLELVEEIHEENVQVNQSLATLEYILMASVRLLTLKADRRSLSKEDMEIEKSLNAIFRMHEITNRNISIKDWQTDYLAYAQHKSIDVLSNRESFNEARNKIKEERKDDEV